MIALTLIAAPAFAEVCPTATDYSARQADILAQLQALPNADGARELAQEMQALWTKAPDDKAQALLDLAMEQRNRLDLRGARDTLNQLIAYCPTYAEGYNQRAFTSFLSNDLQGALNDLDITLALMPEHVAALIGKTLTLLKMGYEDEAQEALRVALELNPWLYERVLLKEPAGVEI